MGIVVWMLLCSNVSCRLGPLAELPFLGWVTAPAGVPSQRIMYVHACACAHAQFNQGAPEQEHKPPVWCLTDTLPYTLLDRNACLLRPLWELLAVKQLLHLCQTAKGGAGQPAWAARTSRWPQWQSECHATEEGNFTKGLIKEFTASLLLAWKS